MKTIGVAMKFYNTKRSETPTIRTTAIEFVKGRFLRHKSQKNVNRKDRLSKLFTCDTDLVYITSDSYCDYISEMNHVKVSPRNMDFLTFDESWNQERGQNKSSPNNSQSNHLWTFIDFDTSKQSSMTNREASYAKVKNYTLSEKSISTRHVRMDGTDTAKRLINIRGFFRTKTKKNNNASAKKQAYHDHIDRKPSPNTLKKPLRYTYSKMASYDISSPTTRSCSTESLSDDDDDDDSFWTDLSTHQCILNDISVRYSKRSEISSSFSVKVNPSGKMMELPLNPNQSHLCASYWAEQNKRPYMEDRFIIDGIGSVPFSAPSDNHQSNEQYLEPITIYGVFDGHAGSLASHYCSDFFSSYLTSDKMFHTDLPRALQSTFNELDKDFISTGNNDGSTACVTLVVGKKKVICANAGDTRAIIIQSDGNIINLSRDHKPNLQEETKRIHSLGGRIVHTGTGTWRVEGRLAVSRSIGDASLKPYISSSE
jgi:serine/threonine protein phosphatase PrpC